MRKAVTRAPFLAAIVMIVSTIALVACGPASGERQLSDVSEVTAYFTQFDKGVGIKDGACSGEAHRFGTLIFTVVSRQLVIPAGAFSYHGCVVHGATAWECLDDKNEGVWMVDGLLHWQREATPPTRLAVTRSAYCAAPGLEGSPPPNWFDRRVCERR